jgi:dTDP-D-glucose 4,6-dehydratase
VREAELLLIDSGLANRKLKWKPQLNMSAAFAETARWYKAAAAGDDLFALSREQILNFSRQSLFE